VTDHPMTPPPELVRQWTTSFDCPEAWGPKDQWIASKAAQWGADEELKAVCQLLFSDPSVTYTLSDIRAARRPKPPSLKEQALAAQQRMWDGGSTHEDWQLIRRALEALPDD
jgi:hypothetical protein